ncbi:uncharacterized phage-associated protein [Clostridium sp. CAG:590]|nr:uncharacterized phage-associated protein [Clostridium sp. CAG:590]
MAYKRVINTTHRKMGMEYRAIDIAKYIVDKCMQQRRPITNLQLQKILYYVQINFIRLLDYPAFGENIEAWQYGPVVPDVYYEYADCGGTEIYRMYEGIDRLFQKVNEQKIVDKVIMLCLRLSPWELVERTHKDNTPWSKVYRTGFRNVIPYEYLYEYAKG